MKKPKSKFAVVDCETDPFLFGRIPKPFIWGYYDGEIFKTFRETSDLVAFIREIKISIYAHNGGKFDWMFLLDHVNGYEKPTIINGRLSKCRIGKCTLLDSYNILPIKLADYQKDEIDYSKFEADVREDHIDEITDYMRGDCVYLFDLVKAYRDEYGADVTQASGAMKTYQKMRGSKVPRHKSKQVFELFKPFYFGGRVQCFRQGIIDQRFNVVDINSAYPFAMTYKHPFGLEYAYGDREMPMLDNVRTFYRVTCISRGAFPYRERPTSGLTFPDDEIEREYFVSDWEYWTAKNARLVRKLKVIECVQFSDCCDFNEYVERFYNGRKLAKLEGDKIKDLLFKLRLNSLYGKFGSDYRQYENFMILPKDFETDEYEKVGEFGEANALFVKPLDDDEMNFFNVATAASITGFVRAYLLAAMVRVGFGNVLYCDTDSLATLKVGSLDIGGRLGQWKDDGAFVKAGIAGKKLYIFKGADGSIKKACKGVKLSDAEMWRLCRGQVVNHKKDSPSFSVTGKARFTERNIKITL